MLLLAILGCSLPLGSTESAHLVERPQNVPPEATAVHLDATGIRVDGQPVVPADALRSDLVNGIEGDLLDALGASTGPVWLNASPDTPWMLVRKLVVTAKQCLSFAKEYDRNNCAKCFAKGGKRYIERASRKEKLYNIL